MRSVSVDQGKEEVSVDLQYRASRQGYSVIMITATAV
jgi:hypothetical protein